MGEHAFVLNQFQPLLILLYCSPACLIIALENIWKTVRFFWLLLLFLQKCKKPQPRLQFYVCESSDLQSCLPLWNPKFIPVLKHWHKHKNREKRTERGAYNVDLYKQITSHTSVEAIKWACEATDYRTEMEVAQGNKGRTCQFCVPLVHTSGSHNKAILVRWALGCHFSLSPSLCLQICFLPNAFVHSN